MRLNSLKLTGFKSFADRTRLEFEPGVTVIVGPNGSGKSNILDAVSWVLGTQSPQSLRTKKMEDLIFAGTATRSAMRRAEVALTIESNDEDLPLITITRRLYRDGTSIYEVNGVECRLIDIQELLSDGGVGRHQHIVVGQGQIDAILNAKPEDQRAVIEEAAGVLKHRLRKERSVRRLERTDADVDRAAEALTELKRRMRPLKRQASHADKHDQLRSELRELRLYLAGRELARLRNRMAEVEAERRDLAEKSAAEQSELDELTDSLEGLVQNSGELGETLERDTAAAARLETVAERLKGLVRLASERSRTLAASSAGAFEKRDDLESEASELAARLREVVEEEESVQRAAQSAEQALRTLEQEERHLTEQENMPAEGAVAMQRGELRAREEALARDIAETEELERRLDPIRRQVGVEEGELRELAAEVRASDGVATAAQETYAAKASEREGTQQAAAAASAGLEEARLMAAKAKARVEALESALRTDPSARSRVEDARFVKGAVIDLLDVPEDIARAVDAALGVWNEALAVEAEEGLTEVVNDLVTAELGGISIVSPGRRPPLDAPPGTVPIIELLGPECDSDLALSLLGDVVVAGGWRRAWRTARDFPEHRVVTREGHLAVAAGVRLARPEGPTLLASAVAIQADAERELARAESRATVAKRGLEGLLRGERDALESLEGLESMVAGAAEAMDRLERNKAALEAEIGRLESRRAETSSAIAEHRNQIGLLERRMRSFEGEVSERETAWEEVKRRRLQVVEEKEAARSDRHEAATSLGAVTERRLLLERRAATVDAELRDMKEVRIDPGAIERLGVVERQAHDALDSVRGHLAGLRVRQSDLRRSTGDAGGRLTGARDRIEELRRAIESDRARMAALAVQAAELRVRDEATVEGIRRDEDASEEEALATPVPSLEGDHDDLAQARLAELQSMGPVNPLAAQEYRELEERSEFLESQLDDLRQARRELSRAVDAVDREIATMFRQAFDEIATHFQTYVSTLFPGGRGLLALVDDGDDLASGLEIHVQPLGKKVSRLSLLSGGERSLAALAFLFAVFKARPSPFYVLDEVEAALDDTNLRRFLRLVDEFRGSAQLVIITHQQQTMEAADVLYGVTMEPGGSSQVVAKRFTESLEKV